MYIHVHDVQRVYMYGRMIVVYMYMYVYPVRSDYLHVQNTCKADN